MVFFSFSGHELMSGKQMGKVYLKELFLPLGLCEGLINLKNSLYLGGSEVVKSMSLEARHPRLKFWLLCGFLQVL